MIHRDGMVMVTVAVMIIAAGDRHEGIVAGCREMQGLGAVPELLRVVGMMIGDEGMIIIINDNGRLGFQLPMMMMLLLLLMLLLRMVLLLLRVMMLRLRSLMMEVVGMEDVVGVVVVEMWKVDDEGWLMIQRRLLMHGPVKGVGMDGDLMCPSFMVLLGMAEEIFKVKMIQQEPRLSRISNGIDVDPCQGSTRRIILRDLPGLVMHLLHFHLLIPPAHHHHHSRENGMENVLENVQRDDDRLWL